MDTATRVQILDLTDCISHSPNILGKGMNLIILPPAMGKQQGRLCSSALVRQLVQAKENSEFKPVKLRLKTDLVSYPARAEGLVNMIIIVMSRHQLRSPRPSPATVLYRPSLPAGPPGYILYRHKAFVCRFQLIVLPLLVHELVPTSPTCLARLTWIIFVMGSRQPYRSCFVGCCFQDLFNIARSILVLLPSNFFSIRLVSVHVVEPYSSIDTLLEKKNCVSFYRSGVTSI